MIKFVFGALLPILLIASLCGCGRMITKPFGFAAKAVVTPVKAVADTTMHVVGKPIRKTVQLARPVTPVIRVR
jgi:predicted small lipoprotein YifL